MAQNIAEIRVPKNEHQNKNGLEWKKEAQNKLAREIKEETAKLREKIPVRPVQRGDTLGALAIGLTGKKVDYSMTVEYRSEKLSAEKKPTTLAEADKIYPGQFVWVEGGKLIVSDNPPEKKPAAGPGPVDEKQAPAPAAPEEASETTENNLEAAIAALKVESQRQIKLLRDQRSSEKLARLAAAVKRLEQAKKTGAEIEKDPLGAANKLIEQIRGDKKEAEQNRKLEAAKKAIGDLEKWLTAPISESSKETEESLKSLRSNIQLVETAIRELGDKAGNLKDRLEVFQKEGGEKYSKVEAALKAAKQREEKEEKEQSVAMAESTLDRLEALLQENPFDSQGIADFKNRLQSRLWLAVEMVNDARGDKETITSLKTKLDALRAQAQSKIESLKPRPGKQLENFLDSERGKLVGQNLNRFLTSLGLEMGFIDRLFKNGKSNFAEENGDFRSSYFGNLNLASDRGDQLPTNKKFGIQSETEKEVHLLIAEKTAKRFADAFVLNSDYLNAVSEKVASRFKKSQEKSRFWTIPEGKDRDTKLVAYLQPRGSRAKVFLKFKEIAGRLVIKNSKAEIASEDKEVIRKMGFAIE